jgi:hypothetical protein
MATTVIYNVIKHESLLKLPLTLAAWSKVWVLVVQRQGLWFRIPLEACVYLVYDVICNGSRPKRPPLSEGMYKSNTGSPILNWNKSQATKRRHLKSS